VNPSLRYTLARLLLLAVAVALFALMGLRGITLWVAAFLGSGAASLLLLSKQRDEMGRGVEQMLNRVTQRIDDATRKEDVD
jgi:hypothetical protein